LRSNGKTTYLEPADPRFQPIYFSPAQDVRFWGVVTGVVRKINYAGARRSVPEPELRAAQNVSARNAGIRLRGTREKYKQKLDGQ
jgi:sensor domain CHASE-containing protein